MTRAAACAAGLLALAAWTGRAAEAAPSVTCRLVREDGRRETRTYPLAAFVDLSKALGFQTVCHTCFFSDYTIADDFDEEYLLKEKDGALQESHCNWGGGKPFRTCPRRAYEKWVKKAMQRVKDLGFRGLHYHDVYSILPPRLCYDPRHPCDVNASIYWCRRQMADTRAFIGGVQSRGRSTTGSATWTTRCT